MHVKILISCDYYAIRSGIDWFGLPSSLTGQINSVCNWCGNHVEISSPPTPGCSVIRHYSVACGARNEI